MKDSRFIELLNLYIDRQISAAETAELEAEIQRHPKRQAVYRQYCQIHSATKTVYESFRAVAGDQPVSTTGHKGVVELFETRRRRANWSLYAGGFAAAACLALVLIYQTPGGPVATPAMAEQAPSVAPVEFAITPVAVAFAPTPEPVLLSPPQAVTTDYTAMLAALREQDEERAFHNERLQVGRIQPLFSDDMFQASRVFTAQEERIYRSQPQAAPASQQQVEFSAFQFQR